MARKTALQECISWLSSFPILTWLRRMMSKFLGRMDESDGAGEGARTRSKQVIASRGITYRYQPRKVVWWLRDQSARAGQRSDIKREEQTWSTSITSCQSSSILSCSCSIHRPSLAWSLDQSTRPRMPIDKKQVKYARSNQWCAQCQAQILLDLQITPSRPMVSYTTDNTSR